MSKVVWLLPTLLGGAFCCFLYLLSFATTILLGASQQCDFNPRNQTARGCTCRDVGTSSNTVHLNTFGHSDDLRSYYSRACTCVHSIPYIMVQMMETRIFFRGGFVTFLAYYWSHPHSRLIERCASSARIGQTQQVHARCSRCRDKRTKVPRKIPSFPSFAPYG